VAGIAPMPSGTTVGLLYAPLQTTRAGGPIRLTKVSITGHGIGSRIQLLSVHVVPTLNGVHSIPQSVYRTDPPVQQIAGVCHVAVQRPLAGYRIPPHTMVRLFVTYVTAAPGNWRTDGVTVTYTQAGGQRSQTLPYVVKGSVIASGAPPPPSPPREGLSGAHRRARPVEQTGAAP
jgi:hypothetical protein